MSWCSRFRCSSWMQGANHQSNDAIVLIALCDCSTMATGPLVRRFNYPTLVEDSQCPLQTGSGLKPGVRGFARIRQSVQRIAAISHLHVQGSHALPVFAAVCTPVPYMK